MELENGYSRIRMLLVLFHVITTLQQDFHELNWLECDAYEGLDRFVDNQCCLCLVW